MHANSHIRTEGKRETGSKEKGVRHNRYFMHVTRNSGFSQNRFAETKNGKVKKRDIKTEREEGQGEGEAESERGYVIHSYKISYRGNN